MIKRGTIFLLLMLSTNLVSANPVSVGIGDKWVMTHESVTIKCLKRYTRISGEYYFKEIKSLFYSARGSHISLKMPVLLETWFVKREKANPSRVLNIHDINNRLQIKVNGYEKAVSYMANDSRMNKMFPSINKSDYVIIWASFKWGLKPKKNRPLTIEYFQPFYKQGGKKYAFYPVELPKADWKYKGSNKQPEFKNIIRFVTDLESYEFVRPTLKHGSIIKQASRELMIQPVESEPIYLELRKRE